MGRGGTLLVAPLTPISHRPDINECLRFGTCSQLCNNTKGSHVCSCAKNFMKTDNMCKAEGQEGPGACPAPVPARAPCGNLAAPPVLLFLLLPSPLPTLPPGTAKGSSWVLLAPSVCPATQSQPHGGCQAARDPRSLPHRGAGLSPTPCPARTNSSISAGSEHQILYIADDNKIRSMYPFNPNSAYEPAFQGDENVRIDAMDIYVKGNKIYWTNWHTGRISYRELPASSSASTASNRNRRQIDGGVTHLNVSSAGSQREVPGRAAGTLRPHLSPLAALRRSRG